MQSSLGRAFFRALEMSTCLHLSTHACIHMCTHASKHTYIHIHTDASTYTHMHASKHTHTPVHLRYSCPTLSSLLSHQISILFVTRVQTDRAAASREVLQVWVEMHLQSGRRGSEDGALCLALTCAAALPCITKPLWFHAEALRIALSVTRLT